MKGFEWGWFLRRQWWKEAGTIVICVELKRSIHETVISSTGNHNISVRFGK